MELVHSAFESGLPGGNPWMGTAAHLQGALGHRDVSNSRQASELLSWQRAAGTYLGRVVEKCTKSLSPALRVPCCAPCKEPVPCAPSTGGTFTHVDASFPSARLSSKVSTVGCVFWGCAGGVGSFGV